MQERVKTSFIPKQSLQTERTRSRVSGSLGIVNAIGGIILLVAIFAAGATFLFEQYVVQAIVMKRESLDRARAAFEPETIAELARLNTRLSVGMDLLNTHTAPSYLFEEIEKITLKSVRFRDFSMAENTPGILTISMSGEAKSFNALALQSDAFGASGLFAEPVFDGLNINDTGNVVFTFDASVDTKLIRYQDRPPSAGSSLPQAEEGGSSPEASQSPIP